MCGWKQVLLACAGLNATTSIFAFSEEEVAEAKEFVLGAGGGKKGGGGSEENESSSDELFRKIRSILDV